MIVRVESVETLVASGEQRSLGVRVVNANSVGAALDHVAPDPREGARFEVTLLHKDVEQA